MNPAAAWIDTDAALVAFCGQVAAAPYLAIDTEFLRERTYYPQLCLIQVSDGTHHALIDIQAELDFAPLLELLRAGNSVNVFHACLQDAEALHHHYGMLLENVFDTQIAWAMLGRGYQTSYAGVVAELYDVTLDKSETRSRWDRRPLSPQQLQYALTDVLHLAPVYETLRGELEQRGRLGWMEEEMARMLRPESWTQKPYGMWQAVVRKLPQFPKQHTGALRELAAWREEAARRRDLPRRHLLADAVLGELACTLPESIEDCRTIIGSGPASRRICEEMRDALARARTAEIPESSTLSRNERDLLQGEIRTLRPRITAIAEEHGVTRELLATRGMMWDLVAGKPDALLRQGWRAQLLGDIVHEYPDDR